ncbi:MAG TPA: transporter substrate-binding domain-containing protein [Victivallales bacterium]|nr:transporter substrate-binding domain-containing protein [Victivallales bacterium]
MDKYFKYILLLFFLVFCFTSGYSSPLSKPVMYSYYGHVKVLRVGTTGDYPPITYYNPDTDKYKGFAIDMAKSLGKHLNVKVKFIKTSWPTLSKDLKSGKFDIAMGGITATKKRGKLFLLSNPIITSGKVALIRKKDKNKFTSLQSIDKKDVTVVENLGGTNLQFAKKNIHNAKIIVVEKNKTVFQYLLSGKADVMFTDIVEAEYRASIMPELYVVNPWVLYDKSVKVYLISKKYPWLQKEVNEWLKTMKTSGNLSKYFKESLKIKY